MALSTTKQQKLFSKAVKKHKALKYREAELIYKKILKDSNSDADTHFMLGTLYAESGNNDSALHYLLQADKLENSSYQTKNNLGNVYKFIGDYENAHHFYQQAIELAPNSVEAYNNLAIICKRRRNIPIAIELYQKAIRLSPSFLEAHYNLGKLYSDNHDAANAFACYQRVVEIDPNYAPVYNQLGDHYRAEKNWEKASEHFHRCLELSDTDHFGIRLKLAHHENGELPTRSPDNLIIESYEAKAASWDQDVNRATMEFLGPQLVQAELDNLLNKKSLSTSLKILDLGCGTGLCGEFLKTQASSLDGVDLSPHMLQIADAKNLYNNLHCEEILSYLQNGETNYDLIVASGVMIFFGQLEKIHERIAERLESNGVFIYTTYSSSDNDINIRSNLHFSHSKKYLRACAKQASLQIISLQEVIHEYDYGEAQQGFLVSLRKA